MVLSKKRSPKALIRLHGCAGLSAPVLIANPRRQGLLYVRDLNIGILCQYTSNHVVRKLQEPYKNFVIAGVNESMLNLMP